jgi:uncharacterized protein
MLVQFSVENFLSYDKEQVFSMVAGTIDQRHPEHIVAGEAAKGGPLLRAAAIYGPNGSGKSNLVNAIGFARDLIVNGTQRGQRIPATPFKLGALDDQRPSKFEFSIRTQDVLYNYGFRVNASRILEEWLFATRDTRELKLFERTTSDEGLVVVEAGNDLTGRGTEMKQFFRFLAQGTRPNQLFLSECGDRNVAQVAPILNWFTSVLTVIPDEFRTVHLEAHVRYDPVFRRSCAAALRDLGTGITDFTANEIPFDIDTSLPEISNSERNDLRVRLAQIGPEEAGHTELPLANGKRYLIKKFLDKLTSLEMKPQHLAVDGRLVEFTLDEESAGTRRLIDLLNLLVPHLGATDRVVILDELDRRFHPHLTRAVLDRALNAAAQNQQFVFTTHDTNLLDLDMLRWDEIWFVEKDRGGASHVYSLVEFKVRPDLKLEKGYLNGRFDALPFITPIDHLGWPNEATAASDDVQETERIAAA